MPLTPRYEIRASGPNGRYTRLVRVPAKPWRNKAEMKRWKKARHVKVASRVQGEA